MEILVYVGLAALVGLYAKSKQQNFAVWTIVSIFISPVVGGIIVAILPKPK